MKKEKDRREIRITILVSMFIGFIFGLLVMNISNELLKTDKGDDIICHDMQKINETIEKINKNCGSTFITKKYASDDWFVFKGNVCDGKSCRHVHIPLEDCIDGSYNTH